MPGDMAIPEHASWLTKIIAWLIGFVVLLGGGIVRYFYGTQKDLRADHNALVEKVTKNKKKCDDELDNRTNDIYKDIKKIDEKREKSCVSRREMELMDDKVSTAIKAQNKTLEATNETLKETGKALIALTLAVNTLQAKQPDGSKK